MLVNINDTEDHNSLKVKFGELIDYYSKPPRTKIASYLGELSDYKMNNILFLVESQMELLGASQTAIKRLFFIMIEALQNAIYHGEKDNTGFASIFVVVGKEKNLYTLHVGNLLLNEHLEAVKTNVQKAKGMDEQAIKSKTRELLFKEGYSIKGGAGLGLMTIVQKSNNNIDFEIIPFNDSVSLFSFRASVDG